jgi:prolyl oligopeptidase
MSRGGRLFFFKNEGLQNQAPLYVQESLGDSPRLLLDPNLLSPDGTVALSVAGTESGWITPALRHFGQRIGLDGVPGP